MPAAGPSTGGSGRLLPNRPRQCANPLRVRGRFQADLAVFFLDPPQPRLAVESLTRRTGASGFHTLESTQHALHLRAAGGRPVAVVLYPLWKDQAMPRFTVLAGGRGVKIDSSFGTDYALLGLESFRFEGAGIDFAGKAGAIQLRRGQPRLALPCRGRLSCGGKTAEKR